MPLRITEMISNFKFHLTQRTMQFTSEQYSWDLLFPKKLESYSILVQSTLLSHPSFAMMRPLETINSRNTIHFKVVSFREINNIKDAKPWLTICTSPIQTKSCPKLHQNLLTVLLSFKVSSGKTTPVFNHSRMIN